MACILSEQNAQVIPEWFPMMFVTEMSYFVKYHPVNPVASEYYEHRWEIDDIVVSALAEHIFRQALYYDSTTGKSFVFEPVSDSFGQHFFGLRSNMVAKRDT